MATQDNTQQEGGGIDFGRLAISALAGAAAGSQESSAGGGFLAGVKQAQGFQDREEAQRRRAEQDKRLATADSRAEATHKQRMRAGDQAFKLNEQRSVDQRYNDRLGRLNSLMGNRANGYNQKSTANMTRGNHGPSSDFVENPDEPAASAINSWSQSGMVMAAGDMMIKGMDIAMSAKDPRVKERAMEDVRFAINKAGGQIHPPVDGNPAFATLKGVDKAFPLTIKGAGELKQALDGRTTAFRKQVQNAYMTAENAQSGALVSVVKGIDTAISAALQDGTADSHQLDDNEIGKIANQFTNWIKRDPQLTKGYTLGNLIKRQLEAKAKGMDRTAEYATGLATMKRYGVKIENLASGSPTIDNDSFNKWMNRNEDSAKHLELLPAGGISKLDAATAEKILNGMGINQQEQQIVAGAVAENKKQGDQLRMASLGKQQAVHDKAVAADDTKAFIQEKKANRDANNLNSKMKSDERLQRFEVTATPARKGRPANKFILGNEPDTIEAIKHIATKRAMMIATRSKNKLSDANRKLYKERMGTSLEADLKDPDRQKFATKMLEKEFGIKVDEKAVDSQINNILASFQSGNGYKRFKHKMDSQREAVQEKRAEAERQQKRKKDIADNLRIEREKDLEHMDTNLPVSTSKAFNPARFQRR